MLKDIILLFTGGVLTSLGAIIIDIRKRKHSRTDLLRAAYSNWFTSEILLFRKMKILIQFVLAASSQKEQHDIINAEIGNIESDIKLLDASLNEIFFLERNNVQKKLISDISAIISDLIELIGSFRTDLRLHFKKREEKSNYISLLETEPEEEKRKILEKMISLITNWDEQCKFISSKTIKDLEQAVNNQHRVVMTMKESLSIHRIL